MDFACPNCGQGLQVDDGLAGQQADCPTCNKILTIPAPRPARDVDLVVRKAAAEPAAEAKAPTADASAKCPQCGAELVEDAILCTGCGLDLRTGRRLGTKHDGGADATGVVEPESDPLEEAKAAISLSGHESRLAAITFAVTVILPAMALAGFIPFAGFLHRMPLLTLAITVAGAAASLILNYPRPAYFVAAVVSAFLLGPGIFFAVLFYAGMRRSLFIIELLIPMVIGGVPGYLLYRFLVLRKARKLAAAKASEHAVAAAPCGRG